ncbi:MAG: hypothetical protein NTX04_07270, partial [Verrucomicrobia bacterium]|nr:hypothetical protein [Verrucomicrobiota bacterium]
GGFLPEARKVNGAERAGDVGADSWDVVTHGSWLGVLDWIEAVHFAIKNAKSLRHTEPLISYEGNLLGKLKAWDLLMGVSSRRIG